MHNRLLALVVSLLVCAACIYMIRRTMLGKAIRALIQEREAAQLVGIPSSRIYYVSFAVAFALAGLAGALLSMFYELTPFMGMPYTITAFIVIVLGGFMLGLFETIGVSVSSPGLRPILSYSLFVMIILIRPEGLFSKKGRV
jgi:branched-chain amino acid transport system permease protein